MSQSIIQEQARGPVRGHASSPSTSPEEGAGIVCDVVNDVSQLIGLRNEKLAKASGKKLKVEGALTDLRKEMLVRRTQLEDERIANIALSVTEEERFIHDPSTPTHQLAEAFPYDLARFTVLAVSDDEVCLRKELPSGKKKDRKITFSLQDAAHIFRTGSYEAGGWKIDRDIIDPKSYFANRNEPLLCAVCEPPYPRIVSAEKAVEVKPGQNRLQAILEQRKLGRPFPYPKSFVLLSQSDIERAANQQVKNRNSFSSISQTLLRDSTYRKLEDKWRSTGVERTLINGVMRDHQKYIADGRFFADRLKRLSELSRDEMVFKVKREGIRWSLRKTEHAVGIEVDNEFMPILRRNENGTYSALIRKQDGRLTLRAEQLTLSHEHLASDCNQLSPHMIYSIDGVPLYSPQIKMPG